MSDRIRRTNVHWFPQDMELMPQLNPIQMLTEMVGASMMVMPMAGAGFFGLGLGIAAPTMTLMLHIMFAGSVRRTRPAPC